MSENLTFRNFLFAQRNGRPAVGRYAIQVVTRGPSNRLHALVHLEQTSPSMDLVQNDELRDTLINRVFSLELKGISLNHIDVVVHHPSATMHYQTSAKLVSVTSKKSAITTIPVTDATPDLRAGDVWVTTSNPRSVQLHG